MNGSVTLDPKTLIQSLPELGSPPVVYVRLMEVMNDDQAGASDVAAVIALDASLTVRLLKLVNSAAFAHRRQIDSVSQAVGLLGMTNLRDLALTTSVTAFFKNVPADLIHADDFWRHSLATGVGAKVIAELRGEGNADRFFVAGLLHDLGRLVLYLAAPEEARAILDHAREREVLVHVAERELAGFDHGTVGGTLMEHWNMPDSLAQSIAHHHNPEGTKAFAVEATTVHLADVIAHERDLGRGGESLVPPRHEGALERLGIKPDALPALMEKIQERYEETVGLFGLSAEG